MIRVLVITFGVVTLAVLAAIMFRSSPEEYCDGKYLMEDLEFIGDMNICMATVACNFGREDVRAYREAVKMINMCSEKAKIEAIPEPDPMRSWSD